VCVCVRARAWGGGVTENLMTLKVYCVQCHRYGFQSKALHMIVHTPLYVPNTVIRRNLQTPTVKEEIRRYSSQYNAHLSAHPNDLLVNLMEQPDNNRLFQGHLPNDLPNSEIVTFVVIVCKV
jgi:hypothetical protein